MVTATKPRGGKRPGAGRPPNPPSTEVRSCYCHRCGRNTPHVVDRWMLTTMAPHDGVTPKGYQAHCELCGTGMTYITQER